MKGGCVGMFDFKEGTIKGLRSMIAERESEIEGIEKTLTEKENATGRLIAEIGFMEVSTRNKDVWYETNLAEKQKNLSASTRDYEDYYKGHHPRINQLRNEVTMLERMIMKESQ